MVKIVNNKGQYKLTIPKDIMLSKGWNEDTHLRFIEDLKGNIILKELPSQKPEKNAKK
jgi:bifunctional DNA-binding transcriptional regulator/antitoxin component of YhaV-PrlF toxin-antitoxin module